MKIILNLYYMFKIKVDEKRGIGKNVDLKRDGVGTGMVLLSTGQPRLFLSIVCDNFLSCQFVFLLLKIW